MNYVHCQSESNRKSGIENEGNFKICEGLCILIMLIKVEKKRHEARKIDYDGSYC